MVQKVVVGLAVFGFLALFVPLLCIFAAHRRWRAGHRVGMIPSPTTEKLVREHSSAPSDSDALTRVGTDDAFKPLMPRNPSEDAPELAASSQPSSNRSSTQEAEPKPPSRPPTPPAKTVATADLASESRPAISRSVTANDAPEPRQQLPRRATVGTEAVDAGAALSPPAADAPSVGRERAD
ncbi:hypothetical protein AURDEDRAFT_179746 [Auricularia subglabra TFB-10046 SS5]|nr:hypothetical protein AURDEDRAFT_179746 [Auricularia subglabra TFB-10046 SS5]